MINQDDEEFFRVLINIIDNFKIDDLNSYEMSDSLIFSLFINYPDLFSTLEKYMSLDMLYLVLSYSQNVDKISMVDYVVSDRFTNVIINVINESKKHEDRIYYPKNHSDIFKEGFIYINNDSKYRVQKLIPCYLSIDIFFLVQELIINLNCSYKLVQSIYSMLHRMDGFEVKFAEFREILKKHPNFSTPGFILKEIASS